MTALRLSLFLALSLVLSGAAHAQGTQCRTDPIGSRSSNCASDTFVTDSIAADPKGTVTEQKNTTGYGLTSSGNCDNTSSNAASPCNAVVSLTSLTNSLGSDVLLTPAATFVLGPSVAQGSVGTFYASAGITFADTAVAQTVKCRLWDGTTVVDSRSMTTAAANFIGAVSFSGVIANPAGNLRVSCKSTSGTTASMLFNQTGDSHDSSITVVRIQ